MNKFKPFILLAVLVLLINVSSAALEVQKTDKGSVIIAEIDNPAIFDFTITNLGAEDTFELYSLVGVSLTPKWRFQLPPGETTFEVLVFPNEDIRKANRGLVTFEYQIKGKESGIFRDNLLVEIVEIKDTLDFEFSSISLDGEEVVVTIKNMQEAHINNLEIEFDSVFFNSKQSISLLPLEEKNLTIKINKERDSKLLAGSYIATSTIENFEGETEFESSIQFLEKEELSTEKDSTGFIIRDTVIKRTNIGNVQTPAKIEITKGIVGRFFTTTYPEPQTTQRSNFAVTYAWEKTLAPGEFLTVSTKTNYTIPFILLIIVIVVGLVVFFSTQKALALEKSVSFVRTKGGEFALKVKIKAKARKHVDSVQLVDSLPAMAHLFEKFGKQPDKIDKVTRRLTWNLGDLDSGEERVFSYIIYSKINIIGRFELPAATAVFQHNGKTKEVWSNRAFFAKEENLDFS